MIIDVKGLLRKAHAHGLGDGFLPFWAGMLAEVLSEIPRSATVLEYGSTGSQFLQVVDLAFPYRSGVGVVLDVDRIEDFTSWTMNTATQCRFVTESAAAVDLEASSVDCAFSHEIFSLFTDLQAHSAAVWRLLSDGGVYYAAIGWHGNNPHTARQSKLRSDKGLPFHLHTLDTIAQTFHAAGFEVGFKRLPMPYFMVYDPNLVSRRFGAVTEMISCLQDHKILFSFRKGGVGHH